MSALIMLDNTLTHFLLKLPDDFTCCQRIKVALRFAELLSFVHVQNRGERPFLIRNISAAHIMVDEDWNPKLYDFGQITGGIFPDKTKYSNQCFTGFWGASEPRDRAFEKYRCYRARVGGENFKFSLVHKSFEADPSFCASDAPISLASHGIV
ncbi:hypothetical protein Salat_0416300 [Sesamum alatum]|uniref:Protein kinase domain-containing protein n=1 Tax=Sesamum alatum TaxID=300844 RepID=A0AAE1Z2X6_9LAMI|nr:hypothetical protein Salat_0416300 [Sesamum alatum]